MFNTTHSMIEVMYNTINDLVELEVVLRNIIASYHSFRPYFEHVGFKY